ncbi:MAG: PIG-L family deacetylase, partial [Bacteroidota bacterium]
MANFFVNMRKNVGAVVKSVRISNYDTTLNLALAVNQNVQFSKQLAVDKNHPLSQPYWLQYPKLEGSFDVRDQLQIGKAENDPAFPSTWIINIGGVDFTFHRALQYKFVDLVKGELYQPIAVLPKAEVNFVHENLVSANGAPLQAE